ncbi:beta-aspartyl-peptidase [Clostridium bowmanii]|uniref:beta-aspartyl-peptidase n=1 Tax=Clostridium bowmanii TaxID=132925 RepID=UPI001C0AF93A|nr:beta-aspartyl-peptidase [Clostridium bowmanii]MBU3188896.1 beta-aspartyl-peptidase [Clostridium bowmanii]MCA1073698.1 beta-aspartyl-peptidase [Clostridium bowmanii]
MITVIKNGEVYAPKYLGKKDVVIAGGVIEGIYDAIDVPENFGNIKVIEAKGKMVLPGFIDSHVHILGGGGEGSFKTRTPEIQLSEILSGGITTVVGCLGTDGVCRDMNSLFAKSRALEEEGITTYIYTGAYDIPVKTITENCKTDVILIDKVIGVGEIALSDHRSTQPTFEQFANVVALARVGGMLSGKAGVVNVHIGDGKRRLEYLHRLVEETEIPIKQVIPTHINRSIKVFEAGVVFAKLGGIVDLTTSSDPDFLEEDEVKASTGLKMLLERGIPVEQISFSSDGQGSMPIFNEKREFTGLGVGSVKSLYREVKDAVLKDGVNFEDAIKVITSNVADNLKLFNKGKIQEGRDGDIVIIDNESLDIQYVLAKGREMVSQGQVIVKGIFEK